jgi:hypothetical protein
VEHDVDLIDGFSNDAGIPDVASHELDPLSKFVGRIDVEDANPMTGPDELRDE